MLSRRYRWIWWLEFNFYTTSTGREPEDLVLDHHVMVRYLFRKSIVGGKGRLKNSSRNNWL